MAALREVYEKAHAGEGRSIRSLRKRLGLTQAEAGQLFGGGVNAFSRYEQGKARPHHSTEILLNLLAKRPELLTDVRAMAKTV
jgi:HTH-type transcriptional regulator/antitoxin MqsA